MERLWYLHMAENSYAGVNMNELQVHAATGMDLRSSNE